MLPVVTTTDNTGTDTGTDAGQLITAHPHRSADERAASLRDFEAGTEPGQTELLVPFLLTVAEDPGEATQVRVEALRLLQAFLRFQGCGSADEARERLIGLLADAADPEVRKAAGHALLAVPGGVDVLIRVRRVLDAEPDKTVRKDVAKALSGHLERLVTTRAADIAAEPDVPVALRRAARAVKSVRVRSPRDLQAVAVLAYACEAASRPDDARLVAGTVLSILFSDDYGIWSPVESALALLWLHAGPDERAALRGILDVGTALPDIAHDPLTHRLNGVLLREEQIRAALDSGDNRWAATYAALEVSELTLLLAYGGSDAWPVDRLAERREYDLALVRSVRY